MSLARGAAAEQGNAFYMSDKVTWPCNKSLNAICCGGTSEHINMSYCRS